MGRKRADSEVHFYPSFAPNPRTGGRKNCMLFVEIVMNTISVTTRLNNFQLGVGKGSRGTKLDLQDSRRACPKSSDCRLVGALD